MFITHLLLIRFLLKSKYSTSTNGEQMSEGLVTFFKYIPNKPQDAGLST